MRPGLDSDWFLSGSGLAESYDIESLIIDDASHDSTFEHSHLLPANRESRCHYRLFAHYLALAHASLEFGLSPPLLTAVTT